MAVTGWSETDVSAIVSAWAEAKIARGEHIYDVEKWTSQARERVLKNERAWPGYIEKTARPTMNDNQGSSGPVRVPPAEALRRLYDAKVGELTRYGVREPDRTTIAVDYACGEIWRCDILPMPAGGIVKLEDDLWAALGVDRLTGVRFPPRVEPPTTAA